jgi:hypothetical protein
MSLHYGQTLYRLQDAGRFNKKNIFNGLSAVFFKDPLKASRVIKSAAVLYPIDLSLSGNMGALQ